MEPLPYPLLSLGILMCGGFAAALAANYVGLPRVTGYLVAGIALSPSLTDVLRVGEVEALLGVISEVALGVIAFAIGGSLRMSRIKMLGRPILWITLTQGLGALACAALAVWAASFFSAPLQAGGPGTLGATVLILGAISVATAPAATLAVVHELQAKGPLTTTLLGVVALDDALTIVLFSGAMGAAASLLGVGTGLGPGLRHGLYEIGGALVLGGAAGFGLASVLTTKRRPEIHLVAILGSIFLVSGLSSRWEFSSLLAEMAMGFTIINYLRHADHVFHQLDAVEETLFCLFFVLAGAHFDIGVLATSAALGLTLLGGRFAGKIVGTAVGGRLAAAPAPVRKYLGITLLPQAGLSVGLIFQARPLLPEGAYGLILNAMLASVILNELISPPLVKWALDRVGERHAR